MGVASNMLDMLADSVTRWIHVCCLVTQLARWLYKFWRLVEAA